MASASAGVACAARCVETSVPSPRRDVRDSELAARTASSPCRSGCAFNGGEHDCRSSPTPFLRTTTTDAWQQQRHGSSAGLRRNQLRGSGRLAGKKAVITGADSGIGRAVALAFAREGADVLVSYYDEHEDAKETQRLIEDAGSKCVLMPGDIKDRQHCLAIVAKAVSAFGQIDLLVNNAAHQASFSSIDDITDEEWDITFRTNIHAMFYLTKAAIPHMKQGSAIINTTSVNADTPSPQLLAYATTKGAIQNFTGGLAQLLAEKGIRVNCVAPGPIWTPLVPSTMPPEKVKEFGKQVPMQPSGPAEGVGPCLRHACDR